MRNEFRRYASIATASLTMMFATGCTNLPKGSRLHHIEFGATRENADVFNSVEDLADRVSQLRKGLSEAEVYSVLGVDSKKFTTLGDHEKMQHVDGPQIPQPFNVEEQERIQARVASYKVQQLNYRNVERRGGVSAVLTTETYATGYDLRLQLIFRDGEFERASIPGSPEINKYDKQTVFEALGEALKGSVNGGVKKGFGL